MRIISKSYDYYDKATVAYGSDPKLLYLREKKTLLFEKPGLVSFRNAHPKAPASVTEFINAITTVYHTLPHPSTIDSGVIAFCGRLYPYWQLCIDNKITYFSFEQLKEAINGSFIITAFMNDSCYESKRDHANKTAYAKEKVRSLRKEIEDSNRIRYSVMYQKEVKALRGKSISDDIFREFNSPIIQGHMPNYHTYELIINPTLSEFEFVRLYNPVQAAQEIEMFLGSNLVKQVDPSANFTDDMKRDAAGFDNWSFRRHKDDKKKKNKK